LSVKLDFNQSDRRVILATCIAFLNNGGYSSLLSFAS
jgi:hypothetical protein